MLQYELFGSGENSQGYSMLFSILHPNLTTQKELFPFFGWNCKITI